MGNEHWYIDKPAVRACGGVVVSQHHLASEVGATILREGGNAVDAALATSFAIGVVEPWMSGLGGGGIMITLAPEQSRAESLNFGMRSSGILDPEQYPLAQGVGGDLFAWPAVEDDRNIHGPLSVAIPGQVAGMALAHQKFGRLPWQELLQPAIEFCKAGLEVDWLTTVRIAAVAKVLIKDKTSAEIYLPDGFVPAGQWGGPSPTIRNVRLADTLQRLADAGAADFYHGDIARSVISDAHRLGIPMVVEDLAAYRAMTDSAVSIEYRGGTVFAPGGLTGGPSLGDVLGTLNAVVPVESTPGPEYYNAMAVALQHVFKNRLDEMGYDADPSCTTHISVADKDRRIVSLTQTLLSVFGSKVTLPETGILMNNGVMWFDPRPGRPNSIAPRQVPLANMCPVAIREASGRRTALGGSGGRRIIGAVAQMCSWILEFGMDLEMAMKQPRIDVSGGEIVLMDTRLPESVHAELSKHSPVYPAQNMVYPNLYACLNGVSISRDEGAMGVPFIHSPVSGAAGG